MFIIYKVDNNAYIYAFLVLLLYCIAMVYLEKKEKLRLAFIYLGSVLFSLFVAEVYYSFEYEQSSREYEILYGNDVTRIDPILGMVPHENSQALSRAKINGELIYEVNITVDEYGRRAMPKGQFINEEEVLFFGCSFTYGDGVEDHQTLPFQFQELAKGNYQAHNFGFSGNGAHQMLAILENELERRGTSISTSKVGFYSMITDHVLRGTSSFFSTPSPTYRFDKQGKLYKTGVFSLLRHKIAHYSGKSNLVVAFNSILEQVTQEKIDLVLSMTERSGEIFEARYDGEFYCLLWKVVYEEREGLYEKLLKGLTDRGIEVIEIDNILPDYAENPLKYVIENDGHPNALANKMIAEYLVDFLRN